MEGGFGTGRDAAPLIEGETAVPSPAVVPEPPPVEQASGPPDDPDSARLVVFDGQARDARRFITDTLLDWHLGHLVRGAVMVGHELVANALRHGTPPADLLLVRHVDAIVIEVADTGAALPRIADIDNMVSTSGRGLRIVGSLSRSWGLRRQAGCKTVWAEIPTDRTDWPPPGIT